LKPPEIGKLPNYAEIIREILVSVNGPVSTEELAAQILQKRPSNARNPHQAALAKIREETGRQLIYLDATHILPLRLAYLGARYRIRLTKENIDHAALSIEECFHHYLPPWFKRGEIRLIDSYGNPIHTQLLEAPHTVAFPSEKRVEYKEPVIVLREWFRSQNVYIKDHIFVTVEDWEQGIFRLERERFGDQRPDLLAERNRLIADMLYEMLESARDEDIYAHIAVPTVYAKIPDKRGYPADHWELIASNDPRMTTDGWRIHYPDSGFSLLDRMFANATGQSLVAPGGSFTKEEGLQVFRLRAQLAHKPSIWREVEVQGKQTLEDLDHVLRNAFQHDASDHLSGFWKRVVRKGGQRKRYREVDVGTVNPFEYAEGSDTAVAALKLQVGDQLKYVYDFGDWIEHTLELQSIGSPAKGVRYPMEVARNKPKYEYCDECQKKGKQTVAAWICYTCSNEEQRDHVLCGKCLRKHEDHYVDGLLY
jgi:Zn finger protein HypA/HybF involved in hydrogenase expression